MKDIRVKANQIELQIREYEAEGDAIIFLHFSGANLMMWQRVIPYFRDHYRLILVDLRGHGKSDRPNSGYHMDDMARDVIGIMHHLNLERAHIIGSSLGAEVGLSLAANYPESILSLTCDGALSSEYGPYGTWEGSENEFDEFVSSQLEKIKNIPETSYPAVDAAVEASRETLDKYGWWNEYVEAMVRYGTHEVEEGKYMKGFSRRAVYDYMKHYFYYRFEDYYRRVKCPLLLLPGEDLFENERERAAMEGLRELTKQGEIVRVSGWVHPYGWLLEPEGVGKAILIFLAKAA
jgi:2-succinyl-6-hydroxy-2,4-cyclohexadiene-1-carboxylate synthase